MGFWGSLFGGASSTLSGDIGQTGQLAGFASGLGQKNLAQSSKFFSDILSGDPTKQAQVLAPEISTVQGQKQQQLKGMAEFGNRSGGTNAAAQMTGDTARASINNMIAGLLGTSASSLASTGSNLLNTGLGAIGQQAQLSQEQMQNWANSILGRGITGGIGAAESMGLGAAGGALAGTGAGAGAQSALLAGLG